MNEILANTKGAVCLINDVHVCDSTLSERDQQLLIVLKKLSETGLTLNKESKFLIQPVSNSLDN